MKSVIITPIRSMLFLVFAICVAPWVLGQGNTAFIKAVYEDRSAINSTVGDNTQAVLFANSNKAIFFYGKSAEKSGVQADGTQVYRLATDELWVHKDMNTNEMRSRTIMFFSKSKYVYVEEELPEIDWVIGTESKQIKGMHCNKAQGTFRGRAYTAWFSPTVPMPYGPWKLGGLPGLIIEAYDTNKEVHFVLNSLQTEVQEPFPMSSEELKEYTWISWEEYKMQFKAAIKKTEQFMRARAVAENTETEISFSVNPMEKTLIED